jgi:hypothetical protein
LGLIFCFSCFPACSEENEGWAAEGIAEYRTAVHNHKCELFDGVHHNSAERRKFAVDVPTGMQFVWTADPRGAVELTGGVNS